MRNVRCWVSILLPLFFLGSHNLVLCSNEMYSGCGDMFSCGHLQGLGYPFWGGDRPEHCGRPEFKLDCRSDNNTSFTLGSVEYFVQDIFFNNHTLKIARQDYLRDICPSKYVNTTVDLNNFNYSLANVNISLLYDCLPVEEVSPVYDPFNCSKSDGYTDHLELAYAGLTSDLPPELLASCTHNVLVPVLKWVVESFPEHFGINVFKEALKQGFEVVWMSQIQEMCDDCELHDGRCGYDLAASRFICLCGDGSYNLDCSRGSLAKGPNSSLGKTNSSRVVIIGASIGSFVGLFLLAGLLFLVIVRKKKDDAYEEEYLDQVPGMPIRFSYEELKIATKDFIEKLVEGGFGSVFKGKLSNGTHIAVKVLDGVGHIKKSFLAEVETIGGVHHINLVRLIGFCDEKSHRALVYEYMPNGSLEKWIFKPKAAGNMLDWKQRRKIILDIAKGLSYLHEDCRQKIVHLDIKPQNILLDEKFNAKVSDFGLSKLIDKDQSNVMMQMRGTPGYLAPEWLNSVITEKVDVYSFGVVMLEILCGRKNLDRSQVEEEMHLLSLFKSKGEENLLLDLVDKCSQDMKVHSEEVVKLMRVAAWCLQSDFAKRPSMSVVIKVLEGAVDVDKSMDHIIVANAEYFKTSSKYNDCEGKYETSTTLLPSILSGPR